MNTTTSINWCRRVETHAKIDNELSVQSSTFSPLWVLPEHSSVLCGMPPVACLATRTHRVHSLWCHLSVAPMCSPSYATGTTRWNWKSQFIPITPIISLDGIYQDHILVKFQCTKFQNKFSVISCHVNIMHLVTYSSYCLGCTFMRVIGCVY